MTENGVDNSSFELSEMEEAEDMFSSNTMDDTVPVRRPGISLKKKVFRHNTDVAVFAARMKSDVILEDGVSNIALPPRPRSKSGKKTVLVSRHNTEVLQRRNPSTPCFTQLHDVTEVSVTRRSVSRQSSSVQSRAQVHMTDDPISITKSIVRSSRLDKSKKKHLKALLKNASKRLDTHAKLVHTHQHNTNTRLIERACDIIESERIILLNGQLGSGKTFTANTLVQCLADTHEDVNPIFLKHIEDIDALLDSGNNYIVVMEDLFGRMFFDETRAIHLNAFSHKFQKMVEHNRHFVVLTCDSRTLENAIGYNEQLHESPFMSIIETTSKLDLDSRDLSNHEELIQCLQHKTHLDNESLKSFAEINNTFIGFPLLCSLQRLIGMDTVFHDPYNALVHHIRYIKDNMAHAFIALGMTIVMNNTFSKKVLSESATALNTICGLFKLPRPSLEDVDEAATDLIGCFLERDQDTGCLQFSNKFVYATFLNVMFSIVIDQRAELVKQLPIDVVSQVCGELFRPCSVNIKLTHSEYTSVLYKIQSLVPQKKPDVFKSIAACRLWNEETFCNLAIAIIGVNVFFCDDDTGCALLVYLTESCKVNLLIKIADFLQTYRVNDLKEYQTCLTNVLSVALRLKLSTVIEAMTKLVWKVDDTVVEAVVESGEISYLKSVLHNSIEMVKSQKSIVFMASKHSRINIVKYLLDLADEESRYTLMRFKDVNGYSVVHYAAMGESPDVFKYFVSNGADATTQTKDGETVLHIAANYGHIDVIRFICDTFPGMKSYTDNYGFTAAHIAAREGHLDALKLLVDHTSVNKVHGANTIIHIAAFNGRNDVLKFLCLEFPDLIDLHNGDSFTAVQVATNMGFQDTFQFFIDIGIDVNSKTVDGRTFLHLAAFLGKEDMVVYLTQRYETLSDAVDVDGNTAAHDAAASGKVKVLGALQHYIDPRKKSSEGCTILHDACYYGRLEMVKYIIHHFPDLRNAATNKGYTPCHGAALGGFIDILSFLSVEGADVTVLSGDGSSLLHEAVFAGQYEMTKFLCSKYPEMIELRNQKTYTPNHFAAQEGYLDIFKYIISNGGDSESVTHESQTFLHIAAYNGRMNVVKNICETCPKSKQINDGNGANAIHYAARGGHENVLMYLMAQGADALSQTDNGSTMLHLAAFDGRLEMVAHICNRVPTLIENVDASGHNAAHYAAGNGHLQLLLYLIGKGIDPMATTNTGCTLILKAAFNGQLEVVKHLSGLYPNMISLSDMYGCNALHYSACSGDVEMFSYLIEKGLDPLSRTSDGPTVLHIAAYHGQLTLVKYICGQYPDLRHMKDQNGLNPASFAELSENKAVQQYFRHDKQRVVLSDASTTCPCCCCCGILTSQNRNRSSNERVVGSCLQYCLRGMSALLCCCRRN